MSNDIFREESPVTTDAPTKMGCRTIQVALRRGSQLHCGFELESPDREDVHLRQALKALLAGRHDGGIETACDVKLKSIQGVARPKVNDSTEGSSAPDTAELRPAR